MQITSNEQTTQNCAFQLALFFKLGFGVERSQEYINYLSKSQRDHSDLEQEIRKVVKEKLGYQNEIILQVAREDYVPTPQLLEISLTRSEQAKTIIKSIKELESSTRKYRKTTG